MNFLIFYLKASKNKEANRFSVGYLVNWPLQEPKMSSVMKQVLVSGSHLIQDLFSMAALGRQKQQQHGGDLDNSIFDYFQNPNWGQMIFCVILVLPKIDLFLVLPVVHMGEHCCFSSIPDGQCSDFLKWYLLTRPLWGQQSGTLQWRGRSCRQARQTHWQGEAQYSPIKIVVEGEI